MINTIFTLDTIDDNSFPFLLLQAFSEHVIRKRWKMLAVSHVQALKDAIGYQFQSSCSFEHQRVPREMNTRVYI